MAGAPAGDVVYGLLRLAGMDVALPLAALREVVPCPPALAGLPVDARGLLGAIDLRAMVLPVVDLRTEIGRPAGRVADQVVVVVAHAGQVLGLLADEVRGVTQVPAAALQPMATQGGELLFSHTFLDPGAGGVVSVLDAAAVLRRPGIPTVADTAAGGTAISDAASGLARRVAGRKLTLARCGPHLLALDVAQVHTTLPSSAARPSVLDGDLCRGTTEFADREVPVVDPLVLLGLGRLPDGDTAAGLVVDLGHGYVVLALTELLEIIELAATDVLPVPSFAVRRSVMLAGMAELDGRGTCLVLDGEALLRDADLFSLAAVNTSLESAAESADGGPATVAGGRARLRFTAGVDVVVALEQVEEILPFPTSVTDTRMGDGLLGIVVHRSAAVPVLCLATLLGRVPGPVTAASCLLLVAVDGERVAFAVDALRGIDPLSWTDDEQPRTPSADLGRVLHQAPLVQVGSEARLLPDLDLRGIGRLVRGSLSGDGELITLSQGSTHAASIDTPTAALRGPAIG